MFDIRKFGGALARLRKNADMTQSELADRLNVTRQAVSRYELGESFPDISILVLIADTFGVSLDALIGAGEPTNGESRLLGTLASGGTTIAAGEFSDLIGLAPLLKPSVLAKLSRDYAKHGIDITAIVEIAVYLNDEGILRLLETAEYDSVDEALLEKFLPMLDRPSKDMIFEKILAGEMDWHFLRALLPHAEYLVSHIEAAVIDGALPAEALRILYEYAFRDAMTQQGAFL